MARILLIDDDQALRTLLKEILQRAGHTVHEAVNGSEAAAIVRAGRVDMVVTDIVMPEKDGLEVIRTLNGEAEPLPIIAMSGGRPLYLDIARKLGARVLLTKPFSPEELLAAVAEAGRML